MPYYVLSLWYFLLLTNDTKDIDTENNDPLWEERLNKENPQVTKAK